MSDMAKFTNISVTTVMRLFDKVVVENNFKELPEVICIDEFKGDSGGAKYHCIIVDPKNGKILDILKDRKQEVLAEYFRGFKNRKQVKWVIIDM